MARSNLRRSFSSITNPYITSCPKLAAKTGLEISSFRRLVSSSTHQQEGGIERQQQKEEAIQKSTKTQSKSKEGQEDDEDVVHVNKETHEIGGPKGPEPTRYGDWEKNGRCYDF